jgi:hypothetical protein
MNFFSNISQLKKEKNPVAPEAPAASSALQITITSWSIEHLGKSKQILHNIW